MKQKIADIIRTAISQLQSDNKLPQDLVFDVQIDRTRDKTHGDLASNIALILAKPTGKKPRDIAELITQALPTTDGIEQVVIAGPGFINFYLSEASKQSIIANILEAGANYGFNTLGNQEKIQVEFVSANPTGPLHVGHGRGAAYGASGANLLRACGYHVHNEYYINDAGRQMDILAVSVWLRYLTLCGEDITFPSNGYQGQYVQHYAQQLLNEHGKQLCHSLTTVMHQIPKDEPEGGDKEAHIDGLIEHTKQLLGKNYNLVFDIGLNGIVEDIRQDLHEFGVEYQSWFSERSLTTPENQVDHTINLLREKGYIAERDGALWFLSTQFGDDKDRVVKRENGQTTYFASDIAYHLNKFQRGFDKVINIWGADHHGYVARVKAALKALEIDPNRLDILLVQFAILYRGAERVPMSTRSGSFVTLRELREEVSNDAARFFYVTRKAEQHMDFDLELAKSQSKDNPVYYIQYAHARVCSILRKLEEKELSWNKSVGLSHLDKLVEVHERDLMTKLAQYPDVVKSAGINFEPHLLAHYLRELAGDFHTYYNAHKMLIDDDNLRNARICLSEAVKQVIANGLTLLGVSAPNEM